MSLLPQHACPTCGAALVPPPAVGAVTCAYCGATSRVAGTGTVGPLILACDFRDPRTPGLRINDRMNVELRSGDTPELLVHMPCDEDSLDEFAPLYTPATFTDLDASITGRFQSIEGGEVPMFALEVRTTPGVSSYRVSVSPLPTFRFAAWIDGVESRVFCDWTLHPALRKGASNRVRLTAQGTQLGVYLNGVLAASVRDDALTSGRVVLCVGPSGKRSARFTVAFSDLELREIAVLNSST